MGKFQNLFSLFILVLCSVVFSSTAFSAENMEIEISGPTSVSVDETVQLNATTAGFGDEDYMWFLSFSTGEEKPFAVDSKTGQVTGKNIGKGTITVFGEVSDIQESYDFYTDSGKDVTLFMSMQPIQSKDSLMNVEIDCEVMEDPPEGTRLLSILTVDDNLAQELGNKNFYLPGLSQEPEWFSQNPNSGIHELIQFPVQAVPYGTYTVYAATFDAEGNINSNIASQEFIGGSPQ